MVQKEHIERQFLDLTAAEAFSGISRRTWQTWIHRGLIPSYRPGTKILLDRDEAVAFIRQSKSEKTDLKRLADDAVASVLGDKK